MPRYFFNILSGGSFIEDEEGLELPDLDAAVSEARASARDMVADAVANGEDIREQVIEITDANGCVQRRVSIRVLLESS